MNATDLTCPFCNARVGDAPTAKVVCPRCGESFANKNSIQSAPNVTSAANVGGTSASATTTTPIELRPPAPRSNRLVLGVTLGVMALLAVAALSYALWTRQTRRDLDKELPSRTRRPSPEPEPIAKKRPPLPKAEPVAPANLEVLGYLPSRTALVIGLHVHEILTSPSAGDFRARPITVAALELRLDQLEGLIGLEAEDLEHVVLGLDGGEGIQPVHLVVRTREKYDPKKLLAAMAAVELEGEAKKAAKRPLYKVKVGPLEDQYLWLADERTFVLGLFSKLDGVPLKPAKDLDLSADLREVITKRLRVGMAAWVAGHSEDWSKTIVPTLLGRLEGTPVLGKLKEVRTFGVGVVPDKPMKAEGAFRCRDEAAAMKLEKEDLQPRKEKDKSLQLQYARDKEWLTAQWIVEMGK